MKQLNTSKMIDDLQKQIALVEGIQHFEMRINHTKQNIEGFCGTFPELRKKYTEDIDTYKRCIKRLLERYNKLSRA